MAPTNQPSNAFITLLTTSSYLPGALVLAHSLRSLHPAPRPVGQEAKLVCLVTPETVDVAVIKQLRGVYDLVIGVEVIGSGEEGREGLELMGRPDLSTALTKLHIFRLSHLFTTLIYLDADVLPLRPLSHLFTLPNRFSACPDTGWPDCFNSGVMVLRPDESDWNGLVGLLGRASATSDSPADGTPNDQSTRSTTTSQRPAGSYGNGSFDGADQGLLNEWFSEEGGGGDWNRLSFTYNVTPSAAYTYAPAYKRYGKKIHAVHFVGSSKPWKSIPTRPARAPVPSDADLPFDYPYLIDRWFSVYDKFVRPSEGGSTVIQKFSVPENVAAWDRPALATRQGRLDLEELKVAAERGIGPAADSQQAGAYVSLPLDGRVDLMRPKLAAAVKQEEETEVARSSGGSSPRTYEGFEQGTPGRYDPANAWNAQVEAPPRVVGTQYGEMREGVDAFFENAWDKQDQNNNHDWASDRGYPQIPDSVRENDWYAGAANVDPDRKKVKAVFPWESAGRARASRVFPHGDTPPQTPDREGSNNLPPSTPTLHVQAPTPPGGSEQATPAERGASPLRPAGQNRHMSFQEAMANYTNAWDDMPGIQRYGKKRGAMPPPTPGLRVAGATAPAQASFVGNHQRRGSDGLEAHSETSHDGDDEQTSSSEMEEDDPFSTAYGRRNDKSGGGAGAGASAGAGAGGSSGSGSGGQNRQGGGRSGAGEGSASQGRKSGAGGTKQYKERGSQTEKTETRDRHAQSSSPSSRMLDLPEVPGPAQQTQPSRHKMPGHSRKVSQASVSEASPPITPPYPPSSRVLSAAARQAIDRRSSSETVTTMASSPGAGPDLLTPPAVDAVERLTTPTSHTSMSDDGYATATANVLRKTVTGRVFDPATSIDARRRDTVEVLARFMRQAGGPARQ